MSEYARGNADRDAFFAALGRVFQEFPDVSKGYAILDFARLAGMVGADVENQKATSRVENGRIVIDFGGLPGLVPGPDECIAVVPVPAEVGVDFECVYYLTS